MDVFEIDPLHDERWPKLVERHRLASIFHTREWLNALNRTYGYSIGAFTTSGPQEDLTNAFVFCRIRSWLTGNRVVSLPFSDHCSPLVESKQELASLLSSAKESLHLNRRDYVELRPCESHVIKEAGMVESASFCHHVLDLRRDLGDIYRGLHPDCVRRKIRRAEREGLIYEEGRSEDLLDKLYQLAILTRRRQGIPPQPMGWFRNVVRCLSDNAKIRVASCGATPAAAIVTLQHRDTMFFKYGFSDPAFHNRGSMQLLLWNAIEAAKKEGLLKFDFGRSEWTNEGLIRFKDRWGATRSMLRYLRHPEPALPQRLKAPVLCLAKHICVRAPRNMLVAAGRILYPHIG